MNPVIDWKSCTLKISVKGLQDPQCFFGLPVDPVAHVELCSLQQITKDLRRNVVEEAQLMLFQPHSELITREVIDHSEAEAHGYIQIPLRCDKLVTEFHDMFDPPGMPVDRDIMHHIELLPNAEPHYRCQYRISASELVDIRRQVDEYLAKRWLKPSCSPWGAPIIFIRKKTGEL